MMTEEEKKVYDQLDVKDLPGEENQKTEKQDDVSQKEKDIKEITLNRTKACLMADAMAIIHARYAVKAQEILYQNTKESIDAQFPVKKGSYHKAVKNLDRLHKAKLKVEESFSRRLHDFVNVNYGKEKPGEFYALSQFIVVLVDRITKMDNPAHLLVLLNLYEEGRLDNVFQEIEKRRAEYMNGDKKEKENTNRPLTPEEAFDRGVTEEDEITEEEVENKGFMTTETIMTREEVKERYPEENHPVLSPLLGSPALRIVGTGVMLTKMPNSDLQYYDKENERVISLKVGHEGALAIDWPGHDLDGREVTDEF